LTSASSTTRPSGPPARRRRRHRHRHRHRAARATPRLRRRWRRRRPRGAPSVPASDHRLRPALVSLGLAATATVALARAVPAPESAAVRPEGSPPPNLDRLEGPPPPDSDAPEGPPPPIRSAHPADRPEGKLLPPGPWPRGPASRRQGSQEQGVAGGRTTLEEERETERNGASWFGVFGGASPSRILSEYSLSGTARFPHS